MKLLDIQSWWEIPSIAHFCSLFRTTFDLPPFDIEELEFSLLDEAENSETNSQIATTTQPHHLLTDLAFQLVIGSKKKYYRNQITRDNYQTVLRNSLQHHCEVLDNYLKILFVESLLNKYFHLNAATKD